MELHEQLLLHPKITEYREQEEEEEDEEEVHDLVNVNRNMYYRWTTKLCLLLLQNVLWHMKHYGLLYGLLNIYLIHGQHDHVRNYKHYEGTIEVESKKKNNKYCQTP